jgi:hypothetical protein
MKTKENNNIVRILLTATVLIVGGYYIQKSATETNPSIHPVAAIIDTANADVPVK